MHRIIVDDSITVQLRKMMAPCELIDSAGNRLGLFQPISDEAAYEGYECPLTTEELDRIERTGGGRPLADILRDLESRQ